MAVQSATPEPRRSHLSPLIEVTTHTNGADALMVVAGDLDAASGPVLRARMEAVLSERPRQVFVDFGQVPFIDSTGVSVLVGAWRRANGQGTNLVVCAPRSAVRRVLDLTGLSDIIAIRSV
jgi:anti-sigma B factor antagonist